jgi:hypothetical protein
MKTTTLAWLAGLLLLVGCQKNVEPNQTDGIKPNQTVRLDATRSYTVTKISDSRCPNGGGVVCIWQGVAEVTVKLNQNNLTDSVKVATLDFPDGIFQRKRTAVLGGNTWTVELLDVFPYPTSLDQDPIDRKIVQLSVSIQ